MVPGTSGFAGGGIYFATCRKDTDRKAQRKGAFACPLRVQGILECRVCLGRAKRISPNGNRLITYPSLKLDEYDSVLIPRPNGHEHVIYDANQVVSIRRVYTWW